MPPHKEKRIFFRSQPTNLILGGLGRYTFPVALFMREIFDLIFIETIDISQNEIEIRLLAAMVVLVMQPFAGDEIQFMKASIIDIPNVFLTSSVTRKGISDLGDHLLNIYKKYGEYGWKFIQKIKEEKNQNFSENYFTSSVFVLNNIEKTLTF